jgi:hypothetical protein
MSGKVNMKTTVEVLRSFGMRSRKTFEALLSLAEEPENAAALIAIFEENREAILGAVRLRLGDESRYDAAAKDVLLRIGQMACQFDPQTEDASDFVCEWAHLECRRLRLELESDGSDQSKS